MYKNRIKQRKRQIKIKPRSWHTRFFKLCGRRLLLQPNKYLQLDKIEASKIIKIIKHHADINFSCFEKLSPLHLACWCGCIKTVSMLISAGVDINIKDKNGWTPLHAAAKHGSIAVCKHLLRHGADANIPNDIGILPLHFAVEHSCRLFNLIRSHTNYDTVLKYCTIKGSDELTTVNKSIMCRALGANHKNMNQALIENILKSGLPHDVLNCPVITNDADYSEDDCDENNLDNDDSDKGESDKEDSDTEDSDTEDSGTEDSDKEDSDEENASKDDSDEDSDKYMSDKDESDKGMSVEDYSNGEDSEEGASMLTYESKKLYLFSPLCYYLWKKDETSKINLDVLKMLIDNNVYIASKFNNSDSLFVPSPIKVALHSLCSGTTEKAKILSVLLENKCDIHGECDTSPAKLLKMSSSMFCFIDTNLALVLLKGSNVVEPEDMLRWIIDNWDSKFVHYLNMLDLLYILIVLSPYVIIPPNIYYNVLYYFEVKETKEKVKEICDQGVRPLASYCRSVVRRQLHDETRDNPRKFKDMLNSLPLPNIIIEYLKFSEIKFIVKKRTKKVSFI